MTDDKMEMLKKSMEDLAKIEHKSDKVHALDNLSNKLREKETRPPISFQEFLQMAISKPEQVFRDIFQLFYDMMHYFVPPGKDVYKDNPDFVGFVDYDCSGLFQKGCDNPFFADRLFSNRLMNLVNSFRKGTLNQHLFLFEGPPGSGKSTFLNNLLYKLEEYTRAPDGAMYKTFWRLDIDKLGGYSKIKYISDQINGAIAEYTENEVPLNKYSRYLEFSCPRHDHPILQVPKQYRKKFLDELISKGSVFKEKLFHRKEYEWVFQSIPCNICHSLFDSILELTDDPAEVFNMIFARKMHFNRQFGEGISIFNPGDPTYAKPIINRDLQDRINDLLKTDNVDFIFSVLAKTNNGVYALMDIKEQNIERLKNLHGIISDGVHKVELVEEHIGSLFMGLVNPEDKIHYDKIQSFQDRIITVNVPYVLDYNTEVEIYRNKFGRTIDSMFLPRVQDNVAKIIISSRLEKDSPTIKRWITSPDKYKKYVDKNFLLLKMDLYAGKIPEWLSEEDVKKFNYETRKYLLAESENEGNKGISGRQSLHIFNDFITKYAKSNKLITMENVVKFFTQKEFLKEIPDGFVESLEDMYDFNVLQEMKESIYYYNQKQISADIQNYLFAINFDIGNKEFCSYTNEHIEITEDFFKNIEFLILGSGTNEERRHSFRKEIHGEYVSKTLAQEVNIEGKTITETELYQQLFERYTKNIKENALTPYIKNDDFRRAITDFGTNSFNAYDNRLKKDITFMINTLKSKFKYTQEGAKQVCVYVIDKRLAETY